MPTSARPDQVRYIPAPGGCGGCAGRICNAPLQAERAARRSVGADYISARTRCDLCRAPVNPGGAGRCGHRPLRPRPIQAPGGCGAAAFLCVGGRLPALPQQRLNLPVRHGAGQDLRQAVQGGCCRGGLHGRGVGTPPYEAKPGGAARAHIQCATTTETAA